MASTRVSAVIFPFWSSSKPMSKIDKLMIALVAGTFAATAWAQGAGTAPAAASAPVAASSVQSHAGGPAARSDVLKRAEAKKKAAAKQKKKAQEQARQSATVASGAVK
jgi:hypothetical protein